MPYRFLSCWFLTPYLDFETTQAMLMMPFTTLTMSETESAHCPYMQLLRFKAQQGLKLRLIQAHLRLKIFTFTTKIFTFATKISPLVADLRPVCGRSFGHILTIGDYFKPKLIRDYHIKDSCVLFINKNLKSSGKILLNLP